MTRLRNQLVIVSYRKIDKIYFVPFQSFNKFQGKTVASVGTAAPEVRELGPRL